MGLGNAVRFLFFYLMSTAFMAYSTACVIQDPAGYFSRHSHPVAMLMLLVQILAFVVFTAPYASPVYNLFASTAEDFTACVIAERDWRHFGRRIPLQLLHFEYRVGLIMHEQHPLRLLNELKGQIRALLV